MTTKHYSLHHSPVGQLLLVTDGHHLTQLNFYPSHLKTAISDDWQQGHSLLTETAHQLDAYFAKKLKIFTIPLLPQGTTFQKQVWQALVEIPFGETCSYGDIATKIKNPKSSRAVGMANNRNPIAIIIPCHRVIGASGKLVGYGGGLSVKQSLLALELQSLKQKAKRPEWEPKPPLFEKLKLP
jgi:methylated-DNA-[protein]-cysteine S-methyltransferase